MNNYFLKYQSSRKKKLKSHDHIKSIDYLTVSGLIQARSGCFRLLHLGRRYPRERSPIKSRLEPSSTDAFICSSFG